MIGTGSPSLVGGLRDARRRAGVRPLALAALGILVLSTRLPWASRVLYNHDAVNYALALHKYDLSTFQPHAPGVPLYVLLGKLSTYIVADPNLALVAVSIFGSLTAGMMAYLFAERWFGTAAAILFALALSTSPLFWFFGEVASPYALGLAVSLAIALGCFNLLRDGESSAVYWTALLLGLSGGIRPDIPLFLAPLWVLGTAAGRRRLKPLAIGALLIGLGTLAWLVPAIWLSGGLETYLSASQWQAKLFTSFSFKKTAVNSLLLVAWGIWGLGSGSVMLALFLATTSGRRALGRSLQPASVRTFLVLWALPPFLFYSLTHIGINEGGYALAYLPPLWLLLAITLANYLAEGEPRPISRRRAFPAICAAMALANAALFLLPAPVAQDENVSSSPKSLDMRSYVNRGFLRMTAQAIIRNDRLRSFYLRSTGARFSPDATVILTRGWYRHVMYYLPDFLVANGHLRRQECLVSLDRIMRSYPANHPILIPRIVRQIVWLTGPPDLSHSHPPHLGDTAQAPNRNLAWQAVESGGVVRDGSCTLKVATTPGLGTADSTASRLPWLPADMQQAVPNP